LGNEIVVRLDLSGMLTVCIGVSLQGIGYTDAIAVDEEAGMRTFSVIVP